MSKWRTSLLPFNEEKDEDTLVEERPQIERGTVFHRDACQRESCQSNSRDKWFPREACLDLGDVKVVKEGGPLFERGMVFLRDTRHREFHPRNIRDKAAPV